MLILPAFCAQPPAGSSRLVRQGSAEAARFAAAGKLGGCTGTIVRSEDATPASPAYLLTAGHCIDLSANLVITDRTDTRTLELQYHIDTPASERRRVSAKRIIYSTMKGLDIALLELDAAPGDLPAAAVLSTERAFEGEAAEWAGVPVVAIPAGEQFLRTSPCTIGPAVEVLEWRWFWRGLLRNDCSDVHGGASGSPVFSTRTGRVVAVISTTTVGFLVRSPEFACWRDNPCEATGYRRDTSYAVPVGPLASCFRQGVFDLSLPRCELDPGRQANVLENRLAVQPGERWNAAVTSDTFGFYRYKAYREGEGDCRVDTGYGAPLPLAGAARITDAISDREGRYYLCVLAGSSPVVDATWQPARFATINHLRVDATKPTRPPELMFFGNSFVPLFQPPDIASMPLKFDMGESDTCNDPQGYRDVYPSPVAIPAGATRLCLIASDLAGNRSEPYIVDLRGPTFLPNSIVSSAAQMSGVAAPGDWVSAFGMRLGTQGKVWVADSAGRKLDTHAVFLNGLQINFRLPSNASLGDATVLVETGGVILQTGLRIDAAAPGIFTPNGVRYGAGAVLAVREDGTMQPGYECDSFRCQLRPLDAPRILRLYAGGLGSDGERLRLLLAGQELYLLDGSELDGVYALTVAIPSTLDLRGILPMTIAVGEIESAEVYVHFR